MAATQAEIATEAEATAQGAGILPLAVPDNGNLLQGSEDYNELISAFSSSLEAFQTVFLTVATDQGQRTFPHPFDPLSFCFFSK